MIKKALIKNTRNQNQNFYHICYNLTDHFFQDVQKKTFKKFITLILKKIREIVYCNFKTLYSTESIVM